MNEESLKIGMYTENEIFKYMTEQEGGMLGRSMYDAVFNKIHNLITENQQLKEDISFCLKSIKQEMEMSIDSRTKQEMLSCYQILSKRSDK